MRFDSTIDFRGNPNIEVETTRKEIYRVTTILTMEGDVTKLMPLIILKGESG